MIKNVIFDFGNVIGVFDEKRLMRNFFDNDEDIELVVPAIMQDWDSLDAGWVEYSDYIDKVLKDIPDRLKSRTMDFFDRWFKCLPYVDGIKELIFDLKQRGYGIYLLSNAPVIFSKNAAHYDILSVFDGILFSGDIKIPKPDRRIYERLLEQFGLNAEECIFADDKAVNIAAARACGIDGFQFKGNAAELADYINKGGAKGE